MPLDSLILWRACGRIGIGFQIDSVLEGIMKSVGGEAVHLPAIRHITLIHLCVTDCLGTIGRRRACMDENSKRPHEQDYDLHGGGGVRQWRRSLKEGGKAGRPEDVAS